MVRRIIITALPALGLLCSCQSEMIQENTPAGRVLTVKATLPGADETRTHVTYGNQSVDYEFFRWDTTPEHGGSAEFIDYISLFNVSKLEKNPQLGIRFDVATINGRSATFKSKDAVNVDMKIEKGDILFVNYWATSVEESVEGKKLFYIGIDENFNQRQQIVKSPDDASMSFMQGYLKMYDIVTVEQDDVIPDLHFRWLSALIRVSLRNETGQDISPAKLEAEYPGAESFFNVPFFCSVDTDSDGLFIYDYEDVDEHIRKAKIKDLYGDENTKIYTDKISWPLYCKLGASITKGDTYDLYLPVVPRINNTLTGSKGLNINILDGDQLYSINVDKFNVPIEAGKRYWFNLTAVKDADGPRLMLTSEWLDKQHSGRIRMTVCNIA